LLPAASIIALAGAAGASETVTYSYDALGRLTATSSSGTVNNGVATAIGYDAAGNRSTYAVTGAPPAPTPAIFSVGDVSATEGGSLTFTVSKSGGGGGASSVNYATANGSAGAGGDYGGVSGTLSFAAAETGKTVSVATIDDSLVESNETLSLNLSGPSAGASISDAQGIGTIFDNDSPPAPPSFSVGDASATEGGTLTFTVTRSGAAATTFTVNYATANGSAAAASDYSAVSGTLSFAPSEATKTVAVATLDDSSDEPAETLSLNLSGASGGASITDPQGIGTIADNDDPPANNPPTPVNDSGSQPKCTTQQYTVTGNDTDPDGDYPLEVISVTGLNFSVFSSTMIQFTSGTTTGTKVGTYTVRDSRGATATANLSVIVTSGICA
jgi:hypothetical protein